MKVGPARILMHVHDPRFPIRPVWHNRRVKITKALLEVRVEPVEAPPLLIQAGVLQQEPGHRDPAVYSNALVDEALSLAYHGARTGPELRRDAAARSW